MPHLKKLATEHTNVRLLLYTPATPYANNNAGPWTAYSHRFLIVLC